MMTGNQANTHNVLSKYKANDGETETVRQGQRRAHTHSRTIDWRIFVGRP